MKLLADWLPIILFFIGAKMLLEIIDIELSPVLSFSVIIATLTLSILFSVLVPRKDQPEESEDVSG
jgi:tellurite resistance protein TerC